MRVRLALNRRQQDDLIEALLECRPLQTQVGRESVLAELRAAGNKFVDTIDSSPNSADHTHNIVDAFKGGGHWQVLVERVVKKERGSVAGENLRLLGRELEQHLFKTRQLKRLRELLQAPLDPSLVRTEFQRCSRNLIVDAPDPTLPPDAYDLLLQLAAFPRQPHDFPFPALQFGAALADSLPLADQTELEEILQATAHTVKASEEFERLVASQPVNVRRELTLLFEMNPQSGTSGYVLSANYLLDGRWRPLATEDRPVTASEAREKFRQLVLEVEDRSTQIVIEVALPRQLLCEPIDSWPISVGPYEVPVGSQYPIVLRWLDRLLDRQLERRWQGKWDGVKQHSGEPLWVTTHDEYPPQRLLARLAAAPQEGIFISFAYPPVSTGSAPADALLAALYGGTPIALWWRKCDPDPAKARDELQALLNIRSCAELPPLLKQIRNHAESNPAPDHPGRRLVLLYDNPDHRPPRLNKPR